MSKINKLLEKLGKYQKSGKGFRVACPVHGGKGATLSVTPKDGDYIVAHCFSCGAGGPEVCEVLNLPISILFPDGEYKPPAISKEMRAQNIEDALFMQLAKDADKLTLSENRLARKSKERLIGYKAKAQEAEVEHAPVNHPALKLYSADYGQAMEDSPALRDAIVDATWEGIEARAKRDDFSSENRLVASETRLPTKKDLEDWLFSL